MKKNKESDQTKNHNKPKVSSSKPFFIWGGLLIIFMGAAFVVFKQYTNKSKVTFVPPRATVVQNANPQAEENPSAPIDQKEGGTPSSRESLAEQSSLAELEGKVLCYIVSLEQQLKVAQNLFAQNSPQVLNQIIARDLCQAVLMDQIPLTTLVQFLQKLNDPWAKAVLASVEGIDQIKTYRDLEKMLGQKPEKKRSLWNKVKQKWRAIIQVRKIDKNGAYQETTLEDLRRSLQTRDPHEILRLYDNLPIEEQETLKDFKHAISERVKLEGISIEILNTLAGGKAE